MGHPILAALLAGFAHEVLPLSLFFGGFVGIDAHHGALGDDRLDARGSKFRRLLENDLEIFALRDRLDEGERKGGRWSAGEWMANVAGDAMARDLTQVAESRVARAVEEFDLGSLTEAKDIARVMRLLGIEREVGFAPRAKKPMSRHFKWWRTGGGSARHSR
jgi:hypothetical protein